MCDHQNREAAMVVLDPSTWCDPCLEPTVRALNDSGLRTVASCCGHGTNHPTVALEDGRWFVIVTPERWDLFDTRIAGGTSHE